MSVKSFFPTSFIQVLPALINVLPLVSGVEIKGNRSLAKVTSPYSKEAVHSSKLTTQSLDRVRNSSVPFPGLAVTVCNFIVWLCNCKKDS